MGQKVHPIGIRLGLSKTTTRCGMPIARSYAKQLINDLKCVSYFEKAWSASVSRVVIERPAQTARVTIHTARPGIVIGKKGEDVDEAAQGTHAEDGCAGSHQHRRDSQARSGCPFGCAECRATAGASRDVPARDEACRSKCHAPGC